MNWDFWSRLFDSSGFMPRRICGTWTQDLIWLHNASDFFIWTAYLAIPVVLMLFAWKRRHELPFRSLFLLFGMFIIACGTTHLLEIVMFYNPVYRLAGLVKLITAAVSWGTVLALFRVVPRALAMKTPEALEYEVGERQRAEDEVRLLNARLEERVRERTAELQARTAELQASTERFAAIVSSSAHIIWTRDMQGNFSAPQPTWAAFTGQTFEELQGSGWRNAIHPDDRPRVIEAWARSIQSGSTYETEYRLRRHDGEFRDMQVRGVPVRDENGNIREWVGTNTDVTEQKTAVTQLQESREQFQTMADSIPQMSWMARPDGYIFWYNQRWYDYTGTTLEEMEGWGWEKLHHPDHIGHCLDTWQTALKNGTPWEDTFPLRSKDGEYEWFLSRARPIRDDHGNIVRWFGTNTNITQARQTQIELRDSEARKSSILATALDCIIGMDHTHHITEWNPAAEKTFGYSRQEAIGQLLPELIIPEMLREAHRAGMAKYLETGQNAILDQRIEVTALRRSGEEFPVELAVTRIEGEGAPFFTAYLRDITGRRQSELDLQRARDLAETANKTKSLFLANMSHELRTPLNAILGYSEMLHEEARENGWEEFALDLEKINGAGKHLLTLINDILDLSKIEAGKMELYLEEFDVTDIVHELTATIQPLIEKNGNTLEIECSPDLGEMCTDLTKFRQSLLNLLSNAAKFTHNGNITVHATRKRMDERDWISLSVRDTGIGMSAEQLVKLFRPFTQADASTTRKFGGTGLGLALTRRFCQMMGGDVTVASTPEEGSTFTIKIPAVVEVIGDIKPDTPDGDFLETAFDKLVDSPLYNTPAPLGIEFLDSKPVIEAELLLEGENPEPAYPTPHTAILVIDDDPLQCELMHRFLTQEGFVVVTAHGGEEGLVLARRIHPLAITLDVMMPDVDGWSVLSVLKNDPGLQDIPVIMLTMVDDRSKGYALGATEYLTKPVNRARLGQVLEKYRSATPPCRILIIEDDAAMRSMMTKMLKADDWYIQQAANGHEALQSIEENQPALILLDLMMPKMDGFEFATTLRRHEAYRNIPIIVLTAKELTAEDRLRLNGCVQKVLQKTTYSQEELVQQVRDLIQASTNGTHQAEN